MTISQYGPEVVLNGNVLTPIAMASTSVTVKNLDNSAATLYTDTTGSTTTSNVVSTDSRGQLLFCAEPGFYKIAYTDSVGAQTLTVVVPEAAVSAAAVNVTSFGLVGDGSTDNAAAIAAMMTALGTIDVHLWFPKGDYKTSTVWPNLDNCRNFIFDGDSAIDTADGARLIYTGAGSSAFISAQHSSGFAVKGMSIAYNNGSFTGDLIDLRGDSGSPTVYTDFVGATLRGIGVYSARSILNLDGAVETRLYSTWIGYAQNGILGRPIGGGGAGYSNVLTMVGGRLHACEVASIRNPGSGWTLTGVTFEPQASTETASPILNESAVPVSGLSLIGCGFWDASVGGYWLDLYGSDIAILGGWMDINQSSTTVLRVHGTMSGLVIKGFHLGSGTLYTLAGGASLTSPDIAPGLADPSTTKGDLLARTSSAVTRLAVGTNGQVLTADSSAATGLAWATPSSGSPGVLATTSYAPGSTTVVTGTSTSLTDADATNLAITFTAPASGNVIVRLKGYSDLNGASGEGFWGLRESSSAVAGTYHRLLRSPDVIAGMLCLDILVTGLTPSSSHTYKWGLAIATAGQTVRLICGNGASSSAWGPALMEVIAAP